MFAISSGIIYGRLVIGLHTVRRVSFVVSLEREQLTNRKSPSRSESIETTRYVPPPIETEPRSPDTRLGPHIVEGRE